MRNILCPTDFSHSAESGMNYAAHLAKVLSAKLTLFYVRPSVWPEAIQLEQQVTASLENISSRLERHSVEIKKTFGVECKHVVRQTTNTVEEAIAAEASAFSLIVMGTNGAENLFQHLFGSTTLGVIAKSKCPVVFVPEGYAFRPVKMIVYGYDQETNPIFLMDQLSTLAVPMKAEVRILHVSTERRTTETERKLEILMDAIKAREKSEISWSADYQYSDDVAWALGQYVIREKADWLAVSCHHQPLLKTIFKEKVVKQLSRTAVYPVLVFWH